VHLSRLHLGTDALGTRVTFKNGFACLIVGYSGTGKSENIYNFAAPVALHPRGQLLTVTYKKASNLGSLLSISNVAIVGDETGDRGALAEGVRLIRKFKRMASQRKDLMAARGIAEVTDDLLTNDPDFPPILLIVDEAQYLIAEYAEMRTLVMSLAHSIRHTGLKILFATQQLSKSVINQEFAQAFTTRVMHGLSSTSELIALGGNDAVRDGFDTTKYDDGDVGRCVLVGDAGGLKECRAYHWTDEHKALLAAKALELRGGVIDRLDLDESKPEPAAQAAPEQTVSDVLTRILAIRDQGPFGDKGVWAEEYPQLCELLGIDIDALKAALQTAGVNPSKQFWKRSQGEQKEANKRGFRFDDINPTKENQS
jgi:hypothetical protein